MLKYVEIDFEYSNPSNPILDVVCCSLRVQGGEIEEFWLLGDKTPFINRVNELKDYTFIAHNVVAEARSFLSLGLKPLDFKWICTFAEWRCITNHNSEMRYGNHLVKGKVKNLIPPRWSKFSDSDSHQKLTHSLAEMVYKLKGIKIDTEHKDMVRDILIAGDLDEVERNRELIMSYCSSDIPHLYPCLNLIFKEQVRLLPRPKAEVLADMYIRSETMVRTAMMEHVGYPIDVDKTRNFTKSVGKILRGVQRDINRQFPTMRIFHFDKKSGLYTRKEKPIKEWIDNSNLADRWDTTETGGYSLSLDAFTRHFNYRHSFPEGNLGAQMVRFLKLKQSLNGFQPTRKKGAKGFWDSVGSDGRARAHLNPYGSQSGRFQPAATGFIFLKAAWMRSLVVPPKGKCIIGIDYKSQEYLIAALLSGDEKMINAYRSGDVYMSYAIDAGIAPVGATKKTHNKERNLAKPVCLTADSLIRVKGLGYIAIADIREGQEVWSGKAWVKVIKGWKVTGISRSIIDTPGASFTLDHLCKNHKGDWDEIGKKDIKWEICHEKQRRLQGAGAGWSDVWAMANCIGRSAIQILSLWAEKSYGACLRWVVQKMDPLRQFSKRSK